MLFCKKKAVSPALLRTSDSAELREAYNRIRTALASRTAGIPCPVIGIATPAEGEAPEGNAPKKKLAAEKIGRNDPCPCGSGKKYKNCCGRNAN